MGPYWKQIKPLKYYIICSASERKTENKISVVLLMVFPSKFYFHYFILNYLCQAFPSII